MALDDSLKSQGVVTSRRCPLCGHHEIGIMTGDGEFRALVPGMLIQVMERGEPGPPGADRREGAPSISARAAGEPSSRELWMPDEIRGDSELCLKYAVWVGRGSSHGGVNPEQYKRAYLLKLQSLIERQDDVPLPVILDRFFAASHLSSGNAEEVAEAMWRELDEVRRPSDLMEDWLKKKDEESLKALIHPLTPPELSSRRPMSEAEIGEALDALTLEEFMRLLVA